MGWIANNSIFLAIGLVAVAAGMVWGWIKTTDKRLLFGAAVPLLLAGGAMLVDQLYESPEQQVRRTLFAIAESIENDDVDATLEAFIPEAAKERSDIRSNFGAFRIREISIKNNLAIEVSSSGRRATAEFNVTADVTLRRGDYQQQVARFFVVYFERDGNRWLIEKYVHESAERGFQRRDQP